MTRFLRVALTLGMIAATGPPVAASPLVGHIDKFEDGTTLGWFVPSPMNSDESGNISTGGLGGADEAFLELTAIGGADLATRLSVLNDGQGAGDYLAAGIIAIRMNESDFSLDDLHLSLLFEEIEEMGPPATDVLTPTPMFVPAVSASR